MNPRPETTAEDLHQSSLEQAAGGAYERAFEEIERAIALDPAPVAYHCTQARLFFQLGDLESAARCFDHALASPGGPDMTAQDHYDHGAVLTCLERHAPAEAAYRRALELQPGWVPCLDNLGVALQCQGRFSEAEHVFRQALDAAQFPEQRTFTLCNLGSLYTQSRQLAQAEAAYRKATQLAPSDPHIHHDLAAVLHALGRAGQAEQSYLRAIELSSAGTPEGTAARRHLADLYVHEDRPVEAERWYRRLIERDPDDVNALSGLGMSLNLQGRPPDAIQALERAVAMRPDDATLHYNLGVICERAQAFERALSAYREAVGLDPGFAAAQENLANVFYRLGQLEQARDAYKRVIELGPESAMAQHLLAALEGRTPKAAPLGYVASVFDDYADTYDQHMVDGLAYCAPERIRQALERVRGSRPISSLLDLGCGTGMMAAAMTDLAQVIHGVDISAKMVAQARERGIYEHVHTGDVERFLRILPKDAKDAKDARADPGAPDWELEHYDVIVAADVFVYLGNLLPVLSEASQRLAPGGSIAFSVEALQQGRYTLQTTGRFAHGRAYIEEVSRKSQLEVELMEPFVPRTEAEHPVPGLVCVLGHVGHG